MSVLCVHCCRDAYMLGLMASSSGRELPCRLREGSRALHGVSVQVNHTSSMSSVANSAMSSRSRHTSDAVLQSAQTPGEDSVSEAEPANILHPVEAPHCSST